MKSLNRLPNGLVISLLYLGFCVTGEAQTERGTIRGTIQDPAGAVIPGADITAINKATGIAHQTVSTDAGLYNIPNLPAGTYQVTAEVVGFKKLVQDNVVVAVAAVVGVDFKMEIGEVSESVTVTAATQLQTEVTERNLSLSERSYMDLPLSAGGQRSPEAFYLLSPGVSGDTFNTRVNGSQALTREIQLDGLSLNDSEVPASQCRLKRPIARCSSGILGGHEYVFSGVWEHRWRGHAVYDPVWNQCFPWKPLRVLPK